MKNYLILLFLFVSTITMAQTEISNLSFDNDKYFYRREPGNSNRSIRYDLKITLPIVQVFTTDNNNKNDKIRTNRNESISKGKPLSVLVSPLLYDFSQSGTTTTYKYGQNGGEGNFDDAEIRVMRANAAASASTAGSFIRPPFKFKLKAEDILSENSSEEINGRTLVKVIASTDQTATIEISRQVERGNVFVCIFDSKGRIIASLDPKNPTNEFSTQSFTVAETVYLLPVIGPKVTSNGTADAIVYEVGDPKEQATMDVEEE